MSISIWENYWSQGNEHDWWLRPAPEVIEFIESQSPKERSNVLDLGCGLGRHAIAFAQRGFSVTAIDASESAIMQLNSRASRLGLPINTVVCDIFNDILPKGPFDIVLSYNVIYHGLREQFALAIQRVGKLLRPGGLFFFTCPTRVDGKYGHGDEIAPHAFLSSNSVTPGDIHYFASKKDLRNLLVGFRLMSLRKDEGYWDNKGEQQFFSNWQVLAEKT